MTAHYRGDPRWIVVDRPCLCGHTGCGAMIQPGDIVFYYPNGKSFYGGKCGHGRAAADDFEAAALDEELMSGRLRVDEIAERQL